MIELNNKEKFAEKIIDVLNTKGFGSLNKNDWEVLMFYLLREYGNLKDLSNYKMSIELQIPETKVKRLTYESDLKYPTKDVAKSFKAVLEKAKIYSDKGKKQIKLVIEDQYLKFAISAKLKESGDFLDYSFNNEIVTMSPEAFVELMQKLYPELKDKKTLDEISLKNKIKTEVGNAIDFKKIFCDIIVNVTSGTMINLLSKIFM